MPARSIAIPHRVGDLGDHRDPADVLRQQHLAHREADRQPRLVRRLDALPGRQRGEHRGVRGQHPVGAAGPDDRDLLDLLGGAAALGGDHLAERPVGDDPGVVVDPAVALGLADHRDDPVGVEHPVVDQRGQLARVGHTVQRDLADLDRLWHGDLLLVAGTTTVPTRSALSSRPGTGASSPGRTPRPHRTDRNTERLAAVTSPCIRPRTSVTNRVIRDVSSLTNGRLKWSPITPVVSAAPFFDYFFTSRRPTRPGPAAREIRCGTAHRSHTAPAQRHADLTGLGTIWISPDATAVKTAGRCRRCDCTRMVKSVR